MTIFLCFRPKSNTVNKFLLSMSFFAPLLLPLVLRDGLFEVCGLFYVTALRVLTVLHSPHSRWFIHNCVVSEIGNGRLRPVCWRIGIV